MTARRLVFAPGAGDALFEPRGVPRQVAVDDDAGVLQVEADAAGIGAEEQAAIRVVAEGEDFAAAPLLRHAAGVPGVADAVSIRPVADLFQHAFPFGENDHLDVGFGQALVEDAGEFVELGAVLALAVLDDRGRVADHAHHGQQIISRSCSCLVSGRRWRPSGRAGRPAACSRHTRRAWRG